MPCGNRSTTERAAASASRVLPLPPGPVRVTIRLAASAITDRRDLAFAADERRHVAGQVRGRVRGPERAGVVGGAGDDQPVQAGRFVEVLDGAEALVEAASTPSSPASRQAAGQGRDERVGDDDLPAVAGRRDPRRVVHVDADVVLGIARCPTIAEPALAEVEAHPDADRRAVRPRLGGERPLGRDRGRGRGERPIEGREERVALGLDDDAAGALDRGPKQGVVAARRSPPSAGADRPLEPRRTLDVGEEERDGRTGRECHRHRSSWQSPPTRGEGQWIGGPADADRR